MLLAVGSLFVLVSLSYAEGTAALPETGGAATFVRRAFNDQLGFLTGWAIFLDYVIVIALAALFVPHYLGNAVGWDALTTSPTDLFVGVGVICVMAAVRFVRRPSLYRLAIVIAGITFVGLLLLIVLGMPLLFSVDNLSKGTDLGRRLTWSAIAFAIPVAMLAYTGLETVANLAAETREPGRTLPRSLFVGIGAAVVVSFLIALVALSAYPADPETQLGTRWLRAPLVGRRRRVHGAPARGSRRRHARVHRPDRRRDPRRRDHDFVLGRGTPRLLARPARHAPARVRAPQPQDADLAGDDHLDGRDLGRDPPDREGRERPRCASSRASYSFGVLIAFTAAQVAVVRLRYTEPDLARPYRAPGNVRIRGTEVPMAALIGAPLTFVIWIFAILTHDAARIAGPIWLAFGALVFVGSRISARERVLGRVTPGDRRPRPGSWRARTSASSSR